jgi:hypothetical protein
MTTKPLPRAAGEAKTPQAAWVKVIGSVKNLLRIGPITLTLAASLLDLSPA